MGTQTWVKRVHFSRTGLPPGPRLETSRDKRVVAPGAGAAGAALTFLDGSLAPSRVSLNR